MSSDPPEQLSDPTPAPVLAGDDPDIDPDGEFDEGETETEFDADEASDDPGPDPDPDAVVDAVVDGEASGAAEPEADPEGPRRRERRERAERRAAQQRATVIEDARREAKRRARGPVTEQSGPADRTVKGLRLVIWLIVLTVLAVALGLVLYLTPLMSARSLVIVDTGAVPREQIVEAAAIRLGTPLLQIDTDQVADRVAGIRQVATARVQREYPSAIRITVVERIPLAFKDYPDGSHLFDRDGVDFATAPPPPGLPYLDVDNPGPTDPPTKAALAVLTALRPEVAAQIGRIAAPSVASVTLTLMDGRTVVWGTTDRTDEKAEKLTALLTQPGRVYDVSSPDLPTVK